MKRLAGAVIDRTPYLWPCLMTFYRLFQRRPEGPTTEYDRAG